ncbi:MAG: exo-alpha-sialidase [Chloroflexi bacterium]|nr:exo-alpha-sialidase [Chloroflexota bacterium]
MGYLEQQELFISGTKGYHTYRIPALEVTTKGTLLAFCEGRKHSRADAGEIDLLLRRSTDGGRTWQETQVVVTEPGSTNGNPAPVVDRDTGTIWLSLCKNPAEGGEEKIRKGLFERTVWLTYSQDDGATWAEPVEITAAVKRPEWTWYATGPCHGIQLQSGRLLIPCDHRVRATTTQDEARHSHVIYSDDHGATWQIGGRVAQEGTNESVAVETVDGAVYLNCRDQGRRGRRCAAWSRDGGRTFPEFWWDETLIEPACQASLARLTDARRHDRNRVLFANPASATRDTLTVRLSYDECHTWTAGKVLHAEPAAYSDLAVTEDLAIFCLYERGEHSPYERLTLARVDLTWLTNGVEE